MNNAASAPNDDQRLQRIADDLGEHYDSVLIVATRCEVGVDGGTGWEWAQSGNGFASKGAVREWIIGRDEDTRIYRRERAKEN